MPSTGKMQSRIESDVNCSPSLDTRASTIPASVGVVDMVIYKQVGLFLNNLNRERIGVTQKMQVARRTHEERSAETRLRMVNATLDCLIEEGYVNATMNRVSERAGMSRGAQTHHFPTKIDLIVASTEHLFNEFAENVDDLARATRDGGNSLEQFIDEIWARFFGGKFMYASLELIVASRSDAELHARLVPLIRNLHTSLDRTWLTFFKGNDAVTGRSDVLLNLTLCLFRGMVVQSVLRKDPQYYDDLLSTWKRIIPMFVSEPAELPLTMVPQSTGAKERNLE